MKGDCDMTSNRIDQLYYNLCLELALRAPAINDVKEINGIKIELTNINDNIIGVKDLSDVRLFSDLLWLFDEDNERIRNQIDRVIETLTHDPTSRTCNIKLSEFANIETIHFLIRNYKLHCIVYSRECDLWNDFPYTMVMITELQKYIAWELYVGCGDYTQFVVNLYVCERDMHDISATLKNPAYKNKIDFNRRNFRENVDNILWYLNLRKNDNVEMEQRLLTILDAYEVYKRKSEVDDNEN